MPLFNKYKTENFKYGVTTDRLLSNKIMILDSDNLQIEATNTVGKSMSIQTIIQAIKPLSDVAKPFKEVYTRKEPVYSVVEWILDDNETFLITGIGFERKANIHNEEGRISKYDLYKYFTFTIVESPEFGINIDNLPLRKTLTNGNVVVQSLDNMENWLKNLQSKYGKSKIQVFGNNSHSRKEYKEKLLEYGISQDEWNEVIIKLNNDNKEGGISEYLERYDTVEKLIRDSLLPLIESSLSKDEDKVRILVIKDQVEKCLNNVIEMQDKLADHKNFIELTSFVSELQNKLIKLLEIKEEGDSIKDQLASLCLFIENKKTLLLEEIETYKAQEEGLKQELTQVKYEEISFDYGSNLTKKLEIEQELKKVQDMIAKEEKDKSINTQNLYITQYQKRDRLIQSETEEKFKIETARNRKSETAAEIAKATKEIGGNIHSILINSKKKFAEEKQNIYKQIQENRKQEDKLELEEKELKSEEVRLRSKNESFKDIEKKYIRKLSDFKETNADINSYITSNFLGEIVNYEKYLKNIAKEIKYIDNTLKSEEQEIKDKSLKIESIDKLIKSLYEEKQKKDIDLEKLLERKTHIDNLKNEYNTIQEKFEINESLVDTIKLAFSIKKSLTSLVGFKDDLGSKRSALLSKLNDLENFKTINFDDEVLFELERSNIKPVEGIKYLINSEASIEYKLSLINKNPLLPYSILVTENEYERLKNTELKTKMKMSIPVLIRSTIEESFVNVSNNLVLDKNLSILTSFDTRTLDPEQRLRDIQETKNQLTVVKERIDQIDLDTKVLNAFEAKVNLYSFTEDDLNLDERINETSSLIVTLSNRIISEENNKNALGDRIKYLRENKTILFEKKSEFNNKCTKIEDLVNEFEIVSQNKVVFEQNEKALKELKLSLSNVEDSKKLLDSAHTSLVVSETNLKRESESLEKEIIKFSQYEPLNNYSLTLEQLKTKFDEYKMDSTSREIDDLNRNISLIEKRIEDYKKDRKKVEDKITTPNFSNMVIINTEEELEVLINKSEEDLVNFNREREKLDKEISRLGGICEQIKEQIFKDFSGRDPLSLPEITDFNFEYRKKSVNKDLEDIKKIISENKNLSNRLEIELVMLKKYKIEGKAITNEPKDVFGESRRLQDALEKVNLNYEVMQQEYNSIFQLMEEFNSAAQERYKKYVDGLLAYKEKYLKQKEQIERVLLVLREEISKVEKHSEVVKNEKNLISRQIKDYIIDCMKEFKTINKLGRHKGEELFNIRLPKDDKIENSLGIVDVLLDEIMEDMNPNDIKQKVNTFYILNRILNISTLPISVITYELNTSGTIRWGDISNKTTGAQRFSIAFIITVILLEYKRYDRNAIIDSSKNKGKVLLIDNPFGETSEEAILIEIFDLAKKFNVQIISYTHVTNESVRKMFKKIYTMTVEKTTSNKEYVDIKELKNTNSKEKEKVWMSSFRIGEKDRIEQDSIFDLIN